jgi:formate-dependent phosphoribosylglycinamide formyltransferase (GAR transformylase)
LCAIGHRQERGDYQDWQPARISDKLYEAQDMAEKVTEALGAGLLSRIFLTDDGVSRNYRLDRMIPEW